MDEAAYVDGALSGSGTVWSPEAIGRLASLQTPDAVLGRRRALLRADASQQWAQWFVEGLVDPRQYVAGGPSYARIFADVAAVINDRFSDHPKHERQRLASSVSRSVNASAELLANARKRTPVSRAQKSFLVEVAGDPVRCWICGTPFDQIAIDNFIYSETRPVPTPAFIDVLKPRGLTAHDLGIQVDHVLPVAHGGGNDENMALACGWCNRSKSAWTSIYDVEGRPRSIGRNDLGLSSLPQPFWTVRQLGVVRRCEHPEGCDRDPTNSPMTVAPGNRRGAINPRNLVTICLEHDPIRDVRLQSAAAVKRLWHPQRT